MQITKSLTYPIPTARLVEVLTNPEFIRSRFAHFSISPEIEVTSDSSQADVRKLLVKAEIPRSLFPNSVHGFLPSTIKATLTETFVPTTEGEGWNVSTVLDLASLPVTAQATSSLAPTSEGSLREVDAEVKVAIPFFGRTIEKALAAHIDAASELEVDSVVQWVQ